MEQLTQRLLRYVKINTRSDEASTSVPSTQSQVEFARMLEKECLQIGLSDVTYNTSNGFLTATLPSNTSKDVTPIGFIAHMDTADFESENVNPHIVHNYDGHDLILNDEQQIILKVADFPNLKNYVGHTLMLTDGTTLLGADNKAGVAAILEAMVYLLNHPEIEHGTVRVAFGPDEEIGRGANLFDAKGFNTKYAYTVDGSVKGELEYESFNAAAAKVTFKGVSVHPGTAKGKMINAVKLAMEFDAMLPVDQVPEKTEGYEGFFLCSSLNATIENASASYIIRDHDKEKFNQKKQLMLQNAAKMNDQYGTAVVSVDMHDSYYNMGEVISKDMTPVNVAKQAMENLGITPIIKPIRGGTDGSKITFMGIPTPNVFTGAENFHGKYEFASMQDLEASKQTILEIIRLFSQLEK
jgi:tripeptide aminopeptidase